MSRLMHKGKPISGTPDVIDSVTAGSKMPVTSDAVRIEIDKKFDKTEGEKKNQKITITANETAVSDESELVYSPSAATEINPGTMIKKPLGVLWNWIKSKADSIYQNKVSAVGSKTKPVYTSANGTFSECSSYAGGTCLTLNGSSKSGSDAVAFAPTKTGSVGQFLMSNGTGEPLWQTLIWTGTQEAYDAITTKDPNTVYLITE